MVEQKTELALEQLWKKHLEQAFGVDFAQAGKEQLYLSLLGAVREILDSRQAFAGDRKVYYISAEFLIGRLMGNNLEALGLYEEAQRLLEARGLSMGELEEMEPEPSLGNGGLGRLAACFLDSIAALGLPGDGIGLNYHLGLFRQEFVDRLQREVPNPWIEAQSWLVPTDKAYTIDFGGRRVQSRMYDIQVAGKDGKINKLHLFDIEGLDESIVGSGIRFDKENIEKNLTLFLYPDDSDAAGHLLRIYQQYFMVSNGARLILDEAREAGWNLEQLDKHVAIQINDTHPSMVIPELVRLLMEEESMAMSQAIEIVQKCCAYTNHTILAEALEKWPISYLEQVVPQLLPIIRELDYRIKKTYADPAVQIIDGDGRVHMAHMDIHYGYSVNGVAAIHTEILKQNELHPFYKLYPEKFNNKTNGITFRRWLAGCNRELSALLDKTIGREYRQDPDRLEKLLAYKEDGEVLEALGRIKADKKAQLAAYIAEKEGVELNPQSIFDIQIKRLHEYKRQQMNALYIIHKYLEIKAGKLPKTPISCIFGAKAAPAYTIAKDIIHLLLVLQEIINKDPEVSPYLQVVMVQNYNVSYAQKLIPACDISEQISLASKEASGTGNMKFMLNGAVTLGTADGANVEIHELVGDENIVIFGEDSQMVMDHYAKADYCSKDYYDRSPIIRRAVDFIVGEEAMAAGSKEHLERLHKELLSKDWFMTLLDLEAYIEAKEKIFAMYEDGRAWRQMSLSNIAKAGFFSSDRTIAEYNKDIWKL